jgi:DNA repair exonuclease SbcCD nuclease subunit
MINLRDTNVKIKKIIHIADVHIRLTKRHDEYIEIFNKFYASLKKLKKDSILFIGGDLFHSKTDLSPECIDIGSTFLKNCADILPTILIAGNHDALLSNKTRLDSITPIVNNLNHSNLFYLKYSGLYKFENILFNNYSVFDDVDSYVKAGDIDQNDLIGIDHTIALFHGPLNGAITDVGYKINNRILSYKLFDGHDIVLLGDIHKFQQVETQTLTVTDDELDKYDLDNEWEIVEEL